MKMLGCDWMSVPYVAGGEQLSKSCYSAILSLYVENCSAALSFNVGIQYVETLIEV